MSLILIVLLPFLGSLVAACLPTNARNFEAWWAGLVALGCLALNISLYPAMADAEGPLRAVVSWWPEIGLELIFRMDGLAWLFSTLVSGIAVLVVVYARYYLDPADPVARFFSFLLAFMGAMLGVVLSGNLIQLALFWELTSLTSFMLIAYWYHRADARRGARMSFTVTATGGLCLLVGLVMLGRMAGSYDLDVVLARGDLIKAHDWYLPTLVLVALGVLTKSAQFPFHFWLPRAMAAPTPVSAFLHSATMVKAGVFLLMRLWPVLAGTEEWVWLIGGAGLITLLLGAFLAIFQQDLKGLLAYSTISHLGLITLLLGMGSPLGLVAAVFHTLNHATFKASLFMSAGIIDHETGTRDLRVLGGLRQLMPVTATLAMVAAAAMAGVPLLNGFLSKEMFFAETVDWASHWPLPLAATLAGLFSVTYSLRFIVEVFFRKRHPELPKTPHEPPYWMRFPVELLVLMCLLVGMLPAFTVGPFLHHAVTAVLGSQAPTYSLSLWHGINPALVMSCVALVGGVLLYTAMELRRPLGQRPHEPLLHRFDGQRLFEQILWGLTSLAGRLSGRLSRAGLQAQLRALVIVVLIAAVLPSLRGLVEVREPSAPIDPLFAVLWLIGAICALATAWMAKYHRLAALALLGGTGLVVCMTFMWFSAPDLALTQLVVEVVTTVLILLGLRWLPRRLPPSVFGLRPSLRDRLRRGRDLIIALVAGSGMALLAYLVLVRPDPESIARFFLERALPEGGGTNVVNVILVDFRGFDTFGEITVLGIVALTVYALLRRFRPAQESLLLPQQANDPPDLTPEEMAEHGPLLVPGLFMRALMPVLMVVAVYLLMRGHNLPGGGFVAGLTMSVAIILQYMVGGTRWVEANLPIRPHRWVRTGLLLAGVTGLGSWVLGYPFLTSYSPHPVLPILGEVPLPSAFWFDLGVFSLVVGATVLMLIALGHQSVRGHRGVIKQQQVEQQSEQRGAIRWN